MSNRSPDFKFIFANAIGFGLNDNEARIIFSLTEDIDSNNVESALEQVGVVMTHTTLRLLQTIVTESLSRYEEASGRKIALPDDKLAAIRATLEVASQKKN